MRWSSLLRLIKSEIFRKNPSLVVDYLFRYAHNIGIHYSVCAALREFSYQQIEFYIPQLCHVAISVPTDSVALEDYIIELCDNSAMAGLQTFWIVQAYLRDYSEYPTSASFRTCHRLNNRIQAIIFGGYKEPPPEKINEHPDAALILAGLVIGASLTPEISAHFTPIALAQMRRPKPTELEDADLFEQPASLTRSNTISSVSNPQRFGPSNNLAPPDGLSQAQRSRSVSDLSTSSPAPSARPLSSIQVTASNPDTPATSSTQFLYPKSPRSTRPRVGPGYGRPRNSVSRGEPVDPRSLSSKEKIRLLKSNYFQQQDLFFQALEQISVKLVPVTKAARLSSLRIELAALNKDLPADIDIPLICPPTLPKGDASQSKHHRVVRISPAEATSLNSAERVPYLLMIEVLREDLDFDPRSPRNQELIANLLSGKKSRRRLFDTSQTDFTDVPQESTTEFVTDSVSEPTCGDLANNILRGDRTVSDSISTSAIFQKHISVDRTMSFSGSSNHRLSVSGASTPRSVDVVTSRSASPFSRINKPGKGQTPEYDLGSLVTHIRIATQMLAQLDKNPSRRPKGEVEAIRSKIIAEIQELEEMSYGNLAHGGGTPVLPGKRAGVLSVPSRTGVDRMENDQKTGSAAPKGRDPDDPSYAAIGEDWEAKKERIRRSSLYGSFANWDLVSVIVKTGADLRQEAFACQLIKICSDIWREHKVDVWVKNMKILVTGESAGLIETITNGVSVHSIKRSLTISMNQAAGPDGGTKQKMASLKDHFNLAFGSSESEAHKAAVVAFAQSLAAYSIITYVFQLKDRHNGNILIDNSGHIIHIDFGFMLSNSPGSVGFEAAPFKLTQEYVDVLGGVNSDGFDLFRHLCQRAFLALRKNVERLTGPIDLMGQSSAMPCYGGSPSAVAAAATSVKGTGGAGAGSGGVGVAGQDRSVSAGAGAASAGAGTSTGTLGAILSAFKGRFVKDLKEEEVLAHVDELISRSNGSYYTRGYDVFQYRTQGIY